jgi:rhodanese-related sulfurtransferase
MKERLSKVLTVLLVLTSMALLTKAAVAKEVPRIPKEDLREMLGNPDVVIIDVRTGKDWENSQSKIKGAVREEPKKAESWAYKYDKDKIYVLYCA